MSKTKISKNEIILNAGEQAPYYGVLLPEEDYRIYVDDFDKMLYQKDNPQPCAVGNNFSDATSWFISGIVLGLAGTLFLEAVK